MVDRQFYLSLTQKYKNCLWRSAAPRPISNVERETSKKRGSSVLFVCARLLHNGKKRAGDKEMNATKRCVAKAQSQSKATSTHMQSMERQKQSRVY